MFIWSTWCISWWGAHQWFILNQVFRIRHAHVGPLCSQREQSAPCWDLDINSPRSILYAKPFRPHPILCGRPNSQYMHLFWVDASTSFSWFFFLFAHVNITEPPPHLPPPFPSSLFSSKIMAGMRIKGRETIKFTRVKSDLKFSFLFFRIWVSVPLRCKLEIPKPTRKI